MEDAIRSSGLFDKPPPKAPKEVHNVKKEDVELIVRLLKYHTQNVFELSSYMYR